ncbi:hypothetical protein ACOMHN_015045 [Nucella lapillus]
MSFFKKGPSKNSRQKPNVGKENGNDKWRGRKRKLDEDIESDSEIDSDEAEGKAEMSSEEEDETPEEKKLRLAKQYLAQLSNEVGADDEEEEDGIAMRLQNDALAQAGKCFKCVADQYTCPSVDKIERLKGHRQPVTCAVISPDSATVFSASKDGTIIKWSLGSGRKVCLVPGGRKGTEKTHVGHTACVLCMAISSDGKYLATGDANNLIHVWDPDTCKIVHTFRGHRKPVTGLSFRRGVHTLFSCSLDRLIKSWNLDEMAYVESHHGTDMVSIDCLIQECAITVGGREREVLVHNFPMESTRKFSTYTESDCVVLINENYQYYNDGRDDGCVVCYRESDCVALINENYQYYNDGRDDGESDCVALINESHFVMGGQDSSLSLWSVNKKKPLYVVRKAHHSGDTDQREEQWVTAVASFQFSDLVASVMSGDENSDSGESDSDSTGSVVDKNVTLDDSLRAPPAVVDDVDIAEDVTTEQFVEFLMTDWHDDFPATHRDEESGLHIDHMDSHAPLDFFNVGRSMHIDKVQSQC